MTIAIVSMSFALLLFVSVCIIIDRILLYAIDMRLTEVVMTCCLLGMTGVVIFMGVLDELIKLFSIKKEPQCLKTESEPGSSHCARMKIE